MPIQQFYLSVCPEQKCGTLEYQRAILKNCWWESNLIQPLWETEWKFLKKLKIELPSDPEIPLLIIYPEKIIIKKDACAPMFIAALFTIARTRKQPKSPSSEEWIKQMWCIYTSEILFSHKKEQSWIISRVVDGPGVCHTE